MIKKAIVSGANGFVGKALVRELTNCGTEVLALHTFDNDTNIPKEGSVICRTFDFTRPIFFLKEIEQRDYEVFFHLAWRGSAGPERANTTLQLENAQHTIECMQLARELGCKKFVCAGSITEIEALKSVWENGSKPGLGYIYGAGKLAAHMMCKCLATSMGLDLCWGIITNAYGPGEISPRLINTTIRKCINKESPIFTAGTQNYDFVYINDVARAFRMIGEKGRPQSEYIIGSGSAKPLKEFLIDLQCELFSDVEFIFGKVSFTGVNIPLSDFSIEPLKRDTGYAPEVDFVQGCKLTYEWLRSHCEF